MKTGNETTVREMDIIRSLIKRVKDGMLLLEGSLLQVEMPKPLARALGTIGTTKRIRRKKQQREAHLVTMTVGLDGMMRRTMDLITGIRVPQIRELLVTMGNQMPHGQKEASFKIVATHPMASKTEIYSIEGIKQLPIMVTKLFFRFCVNVFL
ncbi:uncharacterized protein LOC130139027 isoform X1 [Syzygium oleosum]|uniref:uncharacterized protein LOC130139027 isoform X1 n=1 Tax=Syzygium oleosum TaxID=219896 RepID=UPI0024BB7553|nr:uncharacterized protein LOC130139027 isoform X1 [Syzygium oleosum]